MDRKALIISNPGEINADNYCRGVYVDVNNFISFLKSPLGGAWYSSEIIPLERPTKIKVDEEIGKMRFVDYSFILFTGHGYYSKLREATILELRKGEEYNSLDLRKNTNKRTIILDCCRRVYPEIMFEEKMVAKMEKRAEVLDLNKCRKFFESELGKCPNGIVVGYSCSMNETSGDSPSKGGYYSSGLFDATKTWFENKNLYYNKSEESFSIVSAHNLAIQFVKRLGGGTQNPEIDKPRSAPYFPFAVVT